MNVWLVPSAFHPHRGGVEELTLQLAKQLHARGHSVLVIAPRHPSDLPSREIVEGVDVARVVFSGPHRSARSLAAYPFSLAGQVRALQRLGPRPDVVHVQCPSVQLPAAALIAALNRKPMVITTQGEVVMDAARLYQLSAFMRMALRICARWARALTACSLWAADEAAHVAPAFAAAQIVPNGVDPDQWRPSTPVNDSVFCAWGRHVPQKGFDLLLNAFSDVRATNPAARLLLGGDGPEHAALRAAAPEGVDFLGPLDRAGVQGMLDRSRVAVVPSRLEPFGIVAVEAMAAGRTVVWSNIGGLADATGGLGWSVDPSDRVALAIAMRSALASPLDAGTVRGHARTLDWRNIAARYEAIYLTAASTPRRGRRARSIA